ncbi:MAG: hypothetical protein NTZ64_02860 [Polaromonas sp.]|nr:hypothetical protein [Polaromonas sp.]
MSTTTATATRGHCPDALAAEVYRLTHAAMHRRFRIPSARKTAVPEAVGAAYVRWLASPSDKTEHAAKHHAHWLAKTATVFLLGGAANLEKQGRNIRCVASFASSESTGTETDPNEMAWRAHYEVVAIDAHEDNLLEAIDAARQVWRGQACSTWREAIAVLIARGWTRCHLADALGVSYGLILRYLNPDDSITPRPRREAAIIALAAADGFPPSGQAATVAPAYRKRRR